MSVNMPLSVTFSENKQNALKIKGSAGKKKNRFMVNGIHDDKGTYLFAYTGKLYKELPKKSCVCFWDRKFVTLSVKGPDEEKCFIKANRLSILKRLGLSKEEIKKLPKKFDFQEFLNKKIAENVPKKTNITPERPPSVQKPRENTEKLVITKSPAAPPTQLQDDNESRTPSQESVDTSSSSSDISPEKTRIKETNKSEDTLRKDSEVSAPEVEPVKKMATPDKREASSEPQVTVLTTPDKQGASNGEPAEEASSEATTDEEDVPEIVVTVKSVTDEPPTDDKQAAEPQKKVREEEPVAPAEKTATVDVVTPIVPQKKEYDVEWKKFGEALGRENGKGKFSSEYTFQQLYCADVDVKDPQGKNHRKKVSDLIFTNPNGLKIYYLSRGQVVSGVTDITSEQFNGVNKIYFINEEGYLKELQKDRVHLDNSKVPFKILDAIYNGWRSTPALKVKYLTFTQLYECNTCFVEYVESSKKEVVKVKDIRIDPKNFKQFVKISFYEKGDPMVCSTDLTEEEFSKLGEKDPVTYIYDENLAQKEKSSISKYVPSNRTPPV